MISQNLKEFRQYLISNGKQVHDLAPERLLTGNGFFAILELLRDLNLQIDGENIRTLHSLWLQSTRDCFRKIHNRELN